MNPCTDIDGLANSKHIYGIRVSLEKRKERKVEHEESKFILVDYSSDAHVEFHLLQAASQTKSKQQKHTIEPLYLIGDHQPFSMY